MAPGNSLRRRALFSILPFSPESSMFARDLAFSFSGEEGGPRLGGESRVLSASAGPIGAA